MKMSKKLLGMLITLTAIWLLGGLGSVAHAKTLLTGTITSVSGEKMEGVTVSAQTTDSCGVFAAGVDHGDPPMAFLEQEFGR